jgi:hypothetical protein
LRRAVSLLNALQKNPEVIDFLAKTNKSMGEKFPLTQAHFDGAYFRDLTGPSMLTVLQRVVDLAKNENTTVSSGKYFLFF